MANNHRSAGHGSARLVEEARPAPALTLALNPYGLPLAPVRPERPSAPCDLADYGAGEEFRGWLVVFSRDVDFAVYRRAREVFQSAKEAQDAAEEAATEDDDDDADATDASATTATASAARGEASLRVMDDVVTWLEEILLGWNFVDAQGHPLPQPRDDGAQYCPVAALPAIARAFGKSSQPPKK